MLLSHCDPLALGAGLWRRYWVGEDQSLDVVLRSGLGGLRYRGVVIEDVEQARNRDVLNNVIANNCLHVEVGIFTETVEPFAGDSVAGDRNYLALGLNAVPNSWVDRCMVGWECKDFDALGLIGEAIAYLSYLADWLPCEVGVVVNSVGDVILECCEGAVNESLCAEWANDDCWGWYE